jgi:hypothetical protein
VFNWSSPFLHLRSPQLPARLSHRMCRWVEEPTTLGGKPVWPTYALWQTDYALDLNTQQTVVTTRWQKLYDGLWGSIHAWKHNCPIWSTDLPMCGPLLSRSGFQNETSVLALIHFLFFDGTSGLETGCLEF